MNFYTDVFKIIRVALLELDTVIYPCGICARFLHPKVRHGREIRVAHSFISVYKPIFCSSVSIIYFND